MARLVEAKDSILEWRLGQLEAVYSRVTALWESLFQPFLADTPSPSVKKRSPKLETAACELAPAGLCERVKGEVEQLREHGEDLFSGLFELAVAACELRESGHGIEGMEEDWKRALDGAERFADCFPARPDVEMEQPLLATIRAAALDHLAGGLKARVRSGIKSLDFRAVEEQGKLLMGCYTARVEVLERARRGASGDLLVKLEREKAAYNMRNLLPDLYGAMSEMAAQSLASYHTRLREGNELAEKRWHAASDALNTQRERLTESLEVDEGIRRKASPSAKLTQRPGPLERECRDRMQALMKVGKYAEARAEQKRAAAAGRAERRTRSASVQSSAEMKKRMLNAKCRSDIRRLGEAVLQLARKFDAEVALEQRKRRVSLKASLQSAREQVLRFAVRVGMVGATERGQVSRELGAVAQEVFVTPGDRGLFDELKWS